MSSHGRNQKGQKEYRKDDRNYGSCKPGPRVPQNTVIIIFPEDITGKITGQDVEEALLQKSLKTLKVSNVNRSEVMDSLDHEYHHGFIVEFRDRKSMMEALKLDYEESGRTFSGYSNKFSFLSVYEYDCCLKINSS